MLLLERVAHAGGIQKEKRTSGVRLHKRQWLDLLKAGKHGERIRMQVTLVGKVRRTSRFIHGPWMSDVQLASRKLHLDLWCLECTYIKADAVPALWLRGQTATAASVASAASVAADSSIADSTRCLATSQATAQAR
eukprot:6213457-Pleurochrysis_carterae.AAC.3